MFESAELDHRIEKGVFEVEAPKVRQALLEAQFDLLDQARFPVIILIAGVDGAALNYGGQHAALALKLAPQALANLVHALAGLAVAGDLEDGFAAKSEAVSGVKLLECYTLGGDVLPNLAGGKIECGQHLLRH